MPFHILHVDDDPNIREIVRFSFIRDPTIAVMGCGRADDALAIMADRAPDLILCGVMMQGMEGWALLARLRKSASTAKIPVVYMTARSQTRELDQLKSLGAAAVITTPFDPMKIADTVRDQLRLVKLATTGCEFARRLRTDATMLAIYRENLRSSPDSSAVLESLQTCAHKLAGAAGVFNFQAVSCAASALEEATIVKRAGRGTPGRIEAELDALLQCIERE